MLRSLNEIKKYTLQGIDGEIGSCKDFLFDDQYWVIRYMVADTNKWLPGSRKVLISPISLGEPDWEQQRFPLTLSREGIKKSPPLDEHKPVSKHYEAEFFKYYGYGFYWSGDGLWGTYANPAPLVDDIAPDDLELPEIDRNLRSASEVDGYQIKAKDETIGHIEDFILDDDNWKIVSVVVNLRNWLPGGRKVVISTEWITEVRWMDKSVLADLSAQQIKDSPEYTSTEFVEPEHENTASPMLKEHS